MNREITLKELFEEIHAIDPTAWVWIMLTWEYQGHSENVNVNITPNTYKKYIEGENIDESVGLASLHGGSDELINDNFNTSFDPSIIHTIKMQTF